jgi:hypothetical protein
MLSHKERRCVTASMLSCEKTGADGPFGYRERRQTNSSARIRNCIARSVSELSMGGTGPNVLVRVEITGFETQSPRLGSLGVFDLSSSAA